MILLAEDDHVACQIMAMLFKRLRLEHVAAHSGAETLAVLHQQPVALVIADMRLADMHGLDMIQQIMARPYLQDIPVLCCSGECDTQTVRRALELGCVDYVKKPLQVDVMVSRIERALRRTPVRWEPWRDVVRRLRVDSRTMQPLLAMTRDHLAELVDALRLAVDGAPTGTEPSSRPPAPLALAALVIRVRGAALTVGAIRTVQLLDLFWASAPTAGSLSTLHAALTIELAAFEAVVARRTIPHGTGPEVSYTPYGSSTWTLG